MSDDEISALLDSQEPLVVVEAPAGCGKTYQGANFADREATRLKRGRVLILTHTHAACSVFARATNANSSKVEIKTIDALIAQLATTYHKTLGLPADPSSWARQENDGYQQLASKAARLVEEKPMIARALAERFPVIIGDEHQDTSESQHALMLALRGAGARLRVFGDPMQQIYKGQGQRGFEQSRTRWQTLKNQGA
ncbi:MAG: UvrD-helicase domain-containing protein, partial [Pseudomonadota bacterium]